MVVAPLTVVVEACREAREVAADADRWAADAGASASAVRAGGSRGERCFRQVATDEACAAVGTGTARRHDGGCPVATAMLPADSHRHGANERDDEHGEEETTPLIIDAASDGRAGNACSGVAATLAALAAVREAADEAMRELRKAMSTWR